MQDFSRKVEEACRHVEEKFHEAAPHLNQKVNEAIPQFEKDAQELIAYLNDEVVPAIRTNSAKALRIASQKLTDLAEFIGGAIGAAAGSTSSQYRGVSTAGGGVVGALAGALGGALFPPGERWQEVPVAGHRVTIAPRVDRPDQLAFVVSF